MEYLFKNSSAKISSENYFRYKTIGFVENGQYSYQYKLQKSPVSFTDTGHLRYEEGISYLIPDEWMLISISIFNINNADKIDAGA